jgi:hypothetical protein
MDITLFAVAITVNCASEFREPFKRATYNFNFNSLNLQHTTSGGIPSLWFQTEKDLMLVVISELKLQVHSILTLTLAAAFIG